MAHIFCFLNFNYIFTRAATLIFHLIDSGDKQFHLESLLAQDLVDSGDRTLWSRLQARQIGNMDYDDVDAWLEDVDYPVLRPPKKQGGCVSD